MALRAEDISIDLGSLMADAEAKGKELVKLAQRNQLRVAKGLPPLSTEIRRAPIRAHRVYAIDGASAQRLYEERKLKLLAGEINEDDMAVDLSIDHTSSGNTPSGDQAKASAKDDVARAQREAAAVRHVEDMKNGRINHASVWSGNGEQKLEGGDKTELPSSDIHPEAPIGKLVESLRGGSSSEPSPFPVKDQCKEQFSKRKKTNFNADLQSFKDDLYSRLKVSFEEMEKSLSDIRGRLSEVITATTPVQTVDSQNSTGMPSGFNEWLSKRTPVVFDVGGTKMSFDAICVFHAPPCITLVSKSDSAVIMPRPGARLKLSYDMDGKHYDSDPVTFLGTRFELPMFGMSFVGFIRDLEANLMDAEDPKDNQPVAG